MTNGNLNLEFASTAVMIDKKPSRARTLLPQVIACLVTTSLFLDNGLSISYPTVINAALMGHNNKTNPNEFLVMDKEDQSWIGSIGYLGKLAGSFCCGFASEFFGRRNSMILINIPHFITFYLFYNAKSMWEVFAATVLLGFGSGFMKAPCSTYISETSEPSIRGVLVSITTAAITIGPVIVLSLGAITEWRNISLYYCAIQLATTIALFFIPESPMWLLSKRRDESALKSLRWLRGWVPQNVVQNEFDSIKRYKETSSSCEECKTSAKKCTHSAGQTTGEAIKELFRQKTLKPFVVLMSVYTVAYFSGTHHMNAYMVPILKAYRSPIDSNYATVVVSVIGLGGTFAGVLGLKLMGKRNLYLVALVGITASLLSLSIYGYVYLPSGIKTYSKIDFYVSEESSIPLIVFCLMRFCTTITLMVPYAMLSELFSLKSRSMATAIVTGMNNILAFVAIKSFYNLENWFDLPTTMGVYCAIGVIGLIVTYLILPETEGLSLEDIEIHFADDNKKLTDRHIMKHSGSNGKQVD